MRQTYGSKSVCVVDNGLFVEVAITLAKSFGKTYYLSPWESAFPKSNTFLVGQGLPGIEKVYDVWQVLDDVDLWVFPDVYHGSLQVHLAEDLGQRVWGSRMAEEIELNRIASKEHMEGLGIPIGPYIVLKGMDALREHLKSHDNQWVKISRTRGDMETFHSKNYAYIEPRLDELDHILGAKKHIMPFIVEEGIDDAVEVGYDGYTVDGQFPSIAMTGIEIKDMGYVGVMRSNEDLPEPVRLVNDTMADTLRRMQYRNFLAFEMRITKDGTGYVIDPCCRMGSPPGELVQMIYTNLPDIFWYGAEGECVDPEPEDQWGAELMVHSEWADKNWQPIQFPPDLRDHLKFRNLTVMNGKHYVVPQSYGLPEIGGVVATGPTMEEAIERVKDIAAQLEGFFVEVFPDSLDKATEQVAKLKDFGIEL